MAGSTHAQRGENRRVTAVPTAVVEVAERASPFPPYCLALLTHGEAPELGRCLDSFARNMFPPPVDLRCYIDGDGSMPPPGKYRPWILRRAEGQQGFCRATQGLWEWASETDAEYVLWLENDFELLRPFNLELPAALLSSDESVAQVQLLRESVNIEEQKAGGVIQKHRQRGDAFIDHDGWVQHSAFLTTNPSLLRTKFMAENPWPNYESECEGRFSRDLVERGYTFAIWDGTAPIVRHVGKRRGFGY